MHVGGVAVPLARARLAGQVADGVVGEGLVVGAVALRAGVAPREPVLGIIREGEHLAAVGRIGDDADTARGVVLVPHIQQLAANLDAVRAQVVGPAGVGGLGDALDKK